LAQIGAILESLEDGGLKEAPCVRIDLEDDILRANSEAGRFSPLQDPGVVIEMPSLKEGRIGLIATCDFFGSTHLVSIAPREEGRKRKSKERHFRAKSD
jgi:hypothetical protein